MYSYIWLPKKVQRRRKYLFKTERGVLNQNKPVEKCKRKIHFQLKWPKMYNGSFITEMLIIVQKSRTDSNIWIPKNIQNIQWWMTWANINIIPLYVYTRKCPGCQILWQYYFQSQIQFCVKQLISISFVCVWIISFM